MQSNCAIQEREIVGIYCKCNVPILVGDWTTVGVNYCTIAEVDLGC
jgi:hypothetical protein